MSDWIKLTAQELQKLGQTGAEQVPQDGVQVDISVSPYDVPEAFRGRYDDELDKFVLEFRYPDDEKWDREQYNHYADVRVGKKSGRLYGVEVDVKKLNAPAVTLRIRVPKIVGDAMEGLAQDPNREQRRANYALAKDLISDRRGEIFDEPLTHAG